MSLIANDVSHVTLHTSHVTHHTSHVTRHTSHITIDANAHHLRVRPKLMLRRLSEIPSIHIHQLPQKQRQKLLEQAPTIHAILRNIVVAQKTDLEALAQGARVLVHGLKAHVEQPAPEASVTSHASRVTRLRREVGVSVQCVWREGERQHLYMGSKRMRKKLSPSSSSSEKA